MTSFCCWYKFFERRMLSTFSHCVVDGWSLIINLLVNWISSRILKQRKDKSERRSKSLFCRLKRLWVDILTTVRTEEDKFLMYYPVQLRKFGHVPFLLVFGWYRDDFALIILSGSPMKLVSTGEQDASHESKNDHTCQRRRKSVLPVFLYSCAPRCS